jgi:N-methylhydantoinase A
VNLRVTGIGPIRRPQIPERARGDGRVERARIGRRAVRFDGQPIECSVYSRDRLQPGDVIAEPAIVEEYGATTVVFPGLRAEVDRFGNLLLTRRLEQAS